MSDNSPWGGGSPPPPPPPASPSLPPPPPPPPPGYGGLGSYGGWSAASTPWPPQPRRSRWPFVLVALLVASTVAAVAFVVLTNDRKYPDEWDNRVAELADFVEDSRDLEFDHPVDVDFLSEEEYSAQTRVDEAELDEEATEALDEGLGWYRALGLASGDVDALEAQNDMADSGTLAYYDPASERVTVRGTEMSVNLRVTLVHELTHVLQDQHFDLERDLTPEDDGAPDSEEEADRWSAFQSLVEGDALRIENTYLFSLSSDEQDEYFAEYDEDLSDSEEGLAEVPPAMQAYQLYPYAFGQPLAELLAADGGNSEVDEAMSEPPTTTEHLLDPRSFLDGDDVTGLTAPEPPDGIDEREHGPFGAVDVFFVLAERIDPVTALDAAEGWGDGLWTTYEQDDRTCMRLALEGDTPDDDSQLRAGFDEWAAAMPAEASARITDFGAENGAFLVETCDPGPDAAPGNDRAMDVMAVPVTRAQIMLIAADGGRSVEEAWDIGDCVVRELSYEQLVEANSSTEPSEDLQAAIDDALEACGVPV